MLVNLILVKKESNEAVALPVFNLKKQSRVCRCDVAGTPLRDVCSAVGLSVFFADVVVIHLYAEDYG